MNRTEIVWHFGFTTGATEQKKKKKKKKKSETQHSGRYFVDSPQSNFWKSVWCQFNCPFSLFQGPVGNKSILLHVTPWCLSTRVTGDKPLPESVTTQSIDACMRHEASLCSTLPNMHTENKRSSMWQFCRYWWHHKYGATSDDKVVKLTTFCFQCSISQETNAVSVCDIFHFC